MRCNEQLLCIIMYRKSEQELGNVDDSDGPYQIHAIAQNTCNRVNRRILVKTG